MVLSIVASNGQELDYARVKLEQLQAATNQADVESPFSLRRTRGLILAKSGELWPGVDLIEQTILEALAGERLHAPALNSWVTSLLELLWDQPVREQDCAFFDRLLGDAGFQRVGGLKLSVALRNHAAWRLWLGGTAPQRVLPWAEAAYRDTVERLGADSNAVQGVGDTYAALLFECGRAPEAEVIMQNVIALRENQREPRLEPGYRLFQVGRAAMLLALGRSAEGQALATAGCDGLFAAPGWANTPQRIRRAQKVVGWLVAQHEAAGREDQAAALQQRLAAWLDVEP